MSSIPGSGRSSGGGNGNPLQYSGQENPMDREAWRARELDTTEATEHARMHTICTVPNLQLRIKLTEIISMALTVAQMVKRLSTMLTMWETRVQSLGQEDLLEKEMATHSSILAWKIPWMVEPGRLQSMGLQRVGHNWATATTYSIRKKRLDQFSETQW